MMDMQQIINMMSDAGTQERKNYHMSLGDLIDVLKEHPDKLIELKEPHSYRGYYSDLSLEPCPIGIPTTRLLKELQEGVLDKELYGYKGGEFLMDKTVPLWSALDGECGPAIMGMKLENEVLKPILKEID